MFKLPTEDRSDLDALARLQRIEAKLDALIAALADEHQEPAQSRTASLDDDAPLDLGSDWATL